MASQTPPTHSSPHLQSTCFEHGEPQSAGPHAHSGASLSRSQRALADSFASVTHGGSPAQACGGRLHAGVPKLKATRANKQPRSFRPLVVLIVSRSTMVVATRPAGSRSSGSTLCADFRRFCDGTRAALRVDTHAGYTE